MSVFDWAQVGYVVLSVLMATTNTARLKRRNVRVWVVGAPADRGDERPINILYLIGLGLCFVTIILFATGHAGIFPRFLRGAWFEIGFLKVMALLLLGLALGFHASGLYYLGDNWRVGVPASGAGQLVVRGIYGYSRNPIMLSLLLYALSLWLTYSNLIMFLFLLAVYASVPKQIRQEEGALTEQYGQDYLDYQRRVGRYLTLFP